MCLIKSFHICIRWLKSCFSELIVKILNLYNIVAIKGASWLWINELFTIYQGVLITYFKLRKGGTLSIYDHWNTDHRRWLKDVFSLEGTSFIKKYLFFQVEHFAFRELINLIKLDLSDNALTSVPSAAFETISLLRELVSNTKDLRQMIRQPIII